MEGGRTQEKEWLGANTRPPAGVIVQSSMPAAGSGCSCSSSYFSSVHRGLWRVDRHVHDQLVRALGPSLRLRPQRWAASSGGAWRCLAAARKAEGPLRSTFFCSSAWAVSTQSAGQQAGGRERHTPCWVPRSGGQQQPNYPAAQQRRRHPRRRPLPAALRPRQPPPAAAQLAHRPSPAPPQPPRWRRAPPGCRSSSGAHRRRPRRPAGGTRRRAARPPGRSLAPGGGGRGWLSW